MERQAFRWFVDRHDHKQEGFVITVSRNESLLQNNEKRFLASSSGRRLTEAECRGTGRVVAVELNGLQNTVGSQFLITTTTSGPDKALDGYSYSPMVPEDDGTKSARRGNDTVVQ